MKIRRKRPTFSTQYLARSSRLTSNQNKKPAPHWVIVGLVAKLERHGSRRRLLPHLWWTSRRRRKSVWNNLGKEVENNLDRETSRAQDKKMSHQRFEEGRTRQRWAGMISQPTGSDLGAKGRMSLKSRRRSRTARLLFDLSRQRVKKG